MPPMIDSIARLDNPGVPTDAAQTAVASSDRRADSLVIEDNARK
ncbi:MAG: hypothetical protein ABIH86_00900 [Planctomycetota bacterium]